MASATAAPTATSSPALAQAADTLDANTNHEIPSHATLKSIEDLPLRDVEGRPVPFKSLYTGPNVARRVLVIFIRHFYCGNCQEYIRALTSSITPARLLSLPMPTSIAIVGCGAPALIPMYQDATACPFPIFADPSKQLFSALGMLRTLNMGRRPAYQRKEQLSLVFESFMQIVKTAPSGKVLQGGDISQVGGEFLFEPLDPPPGSAAPAGSEHGEGEEKRLTWCHRMQNTRDHAEISELSALLGLDGETGATGKNEKPSSDALSAQKKTDRTG